MYELALLTGGGVLLVLVIVVIMHYYYHCCGCQEMQVYAKLLLLQLFYCENVSFSCF